MKILDLFCGAGGAAMGYHRAGFEVIGVDHVAQPHYPFQFIRADWRDVVGRVTVDAVHASPPCQAYSAMTNCRPGLSDTYPDLVEDVRAVLKTLDVPWVIENVPGAPLINPITLCGQMFGLDLYRHRLFETSFNAVEPYHPFHLKPASRAGHWKPGTVMSVAGHFAPMSVAKQAMGITWMNRDELGEAIPPAYTEYLGRFLTRIVGRKAVVQGTHHHYP